MTSSGPIIWTRTAYLKSALEPGWSLLLAVDPVKVHLFWLEHMLIGLQPVAQGFQLLWCFAVLTTFLQEGSDLLDEH